MSWFSERKGITKIRAEIQINTMDDALRNQLWNLLDLFYWQDMHDDRLIDNGALYKLVMSMWNYYYKEPVDTVPKRWRDSLHLIRARFFDSQWSQVYDLLEVVVQFSDKNEAFQNACNTVLEKELSAYRFVNGKIVEITSKEEIAEIEGAINSPLVIVNTHLQNSLRLLSDRTSPDYINSIKESISAVEAISKLITKNEKTDLSGALAAIEGQGKITLHPALRRAFLNLYGYTCDADGIRHALKDEKVKSDFDEAKFMLVACSAFVNYLISKSAKAGIKI